MGDQPKLLFVLPSVGGGGAERAALDLMRSMDRRKFRLTLVLFTHVGSFRQQLPEDVRTYDLRGRQSYDIRLIWRLAKVMRSEAPDIVFSVLRYANLITLLALRLSASSARVVVNEQNLPSAEFALFGGGRVKGWFLERLYPQADCVTAISAGIAQELAKMHRIPERMIQVIPNPVDLARIRALAAEKLEHPWFRLGQPVLVAAGRLHPQKGFSYLIRAFATVRRAVPCKLFILGEGPLRSELEGLITSLGLGDDVGLPGFQENPYNYMSRGTAFVLSSLYEGFGNVLVEALALGTPVIATRCPVGPEEILQNEVTGILVPPADEGALAQAILRVLGDSELRQRLSSNGPTRAAEFAVERIIAQYEALFQRIAGCPAAGTGQAEQCPGDGLSGVPRCAS